MVFKSLFATSSIVKRIYKPSIVLIALVSATFISATKSLAVYYSGRGVTSGQTVGYSGARARLLAPNKLLGSGEYVRGYTGVYDDNKTGVYMTAGPIQDCVSGRFCSWHPSASWRTSTGGSSYVDTTINLTPDSNASYRVDYSGSGSWAAQIVRSGTTYTIYNKFLSLSRPMTTVGAGGEANYTGTNVGRLSNASLNQYRLGGTSSVRGYTYTRRVRNDLDVGISPPLGDPYYEWFVTGP